MDAAASAAVFTPARSAQPALAPPGAAPSAARSAITSDFETFLKMLTAQIQNQDPLRPTPSDEFAVQLATFSGVEQQVRSNELLAALGAQFGAMGMAQFAGWVGMEARTAAPVQFRGAPVTLSPNPAAGADRAELVVRDAGGREVERLEVPVSTDPIAWSGLGPDGRPYLPGTYSFELVSFSAGMPVASTPVEAYSRVVEVRGEGGRTVLVLEGGTEVAATEVTALREPAGT
jgi:flagellar basal-body rod modification protein FlgD